MTDRTSPNVYTKIGVRPVINAVGRRTVYGGALPSPVVARAMEEASQTYVEMQELLERSGEYIAEVLGVEAAYVTSGCAAALVLSSAACIAGNDQEKMSRLPDSTGMSNEIIIQRRQRYHYDRMYSVAGGRLVEAGDADGCTLEQLDGSFGPATAAVGYYVRPDWESSVLSLVDVVEVAHTHEVPVIVDAAAQNHPLDHFLKMAQSSDLVCYSAKYIGGPNSAGFVCGKRALVEAAAANGFIGYETGGGHVLGRAMKVDRQEVVAVVAALDAWFSMDHEERLLEYGAKLSAIERALHGIPGVQAKVVQIAEYEGLHLHVVLDSAVSGKNSQEVVGALNAGNPRVTVRSDEDAIIVISASALNEGEEHIVADRLRGVLTS